MPIRELFCATASIDTDRICGIIRKSMCFTHRDVAVSTIFGCDKPRNHRSPCRTFLRSRSSDCVMQSSMISLIPFKNCSVTWSVASVFAVADVVAFSAADGSCSSFCYPVFILLIRLVIRLLIRAPATLPASPSLSPLSFDPAQPEPTAPAAACASAKSI